MKLHRQLSLILLPLCLIGCDMPTKPGVTGTKFEKTTVDHTKFTVECSECHEETRPEPILDVAHGFGRDCHECHEYKTGVTVWTPMAFSHSPAPTECMGCHGADRNTDPTHPTTGDCVSCHTYPDWAATKDP